MQKDATLFKASGSMRNTQAIINSYNYTVIDNYPTGYAQIRSPIFLAGIRPILEGKSPAETVLPEVARRIDAYVAETMKNSK